MKDKHYLLGIVAVIALILLLVWVWNHRQPPRSAHPERFLESTVPIDR